MKKINKKKAVRNTIEHIVYLYCNRKFNHVTEDCLLAFYQYRFGSIKKYNKKVMKKLEKYFKFKSAGENIILGRVYKIKEKRSNPLKDYKKQKRKEDKWIKRNEIRCK